jgi:2-oxoglutarate dehydrogenase E2 component (dihydrolipoamide succinyltransferase)
LNVDVTMPHWGDGYRGTITRWFKQVGERVEVDEPLFEVSTDKVDSEVPAPQAGFVSEIVVPEGKPFPSARVSRDFRASRCAPADAPAAAPAPEPQAAPAPEPAPTPPAQEAAAPPPAPAPPPPAPAPAAPAARATAHAAPAPAPAAPAAPAPPRRRRPPTAAVL